MVETGQTRTSSLGAARPLPPSADIGPGWQSAGQAAQFCLERMFSVHGPTWSQFRSPTLLGDVFVFCQQSYQAMKSRVVKSDCPTLAVRRKCEFKNDRTIREVSQGIRFQVPDSLGHRLRFKPPAHPDRTDGLLQTFVRRSHVNLFTTFASR